MRICPEIVHALRQPLVFLVQSSQVRFHRVDFILRPPHRQKSVRTQHIVHHQHRDQHAQDAAPISAPQLRKLLVIIHALQSFKIQSVASFASFAEAAALSASMYKRSKGSVPLNLASIQDPSSNTNFAPSVRSVDTTLRPRSVELSTATFLMAFAFCSSLKCRFSRTGQNSRPNLLNIAFSCSPMDAPRAAIISAT